MPSANNQISTEITTGNLLQDYCDLFECTPFAVILYDLTGNIIYINPAMEKLFGYEKKEIEGQHYSILTTYEPNQIEKIEQRFKRLQNNKKVEPMEIRCIKKDGSTFWGISRISHIQINQTFYYQGLIHDITDRKMVECKLKESEQKYRESFNQAEFYRELLSHDMNNILSIIGNTLDFLMIKLEDKSEFSDVKEIIRIIKKAKNKGDRLLTKIKLLSNLKDKSIPTDEIDLKPHLSKAIKYIIQNYSNKVNDIPVKYSNDSIKSNLKVMGGQLLSEAFKNILINGITHNDSNEIEISVLVSLIEIRHKKHVKLEFLDNGIGISVEEQDKIFTRIYKREGTKGLGIGLTLVKKIIESYQGKIFVENRIKGDHSQGCNFIVLLECAD